MTQFGTQVQTKLHARLATAAALPTCTYTDASGVLPTSSLGARLTATSAAALTVDGVTTAYDDVVIVKDQVAGLQNGVYVVANPGSTSSAWQLRRHDQAQESGQFAGMLVTTGAEGTANPSATFLYSGTVDPIIGTTAITFSGGSIGANTSTVAALSADPQFFVPATTDTVAPLATGSTIECFINPAGTIAAMTLTLPTGAFKGQRLTANFTQIVTTLTVTNTNTDTKGLAQPTAATATSAFEWVWDSVSAKWNRVR